MSLFRFLPQITAAKGIAFPPVRRRREQVEVVSHGRE
jgi:hypothetical protein